MLFTFKRDDEGRERIYVGDVCVARFIEAEENPSAHKAMDFERVSDVLGVGQLPICDVIESAMDAGFWDPEPSKEARKYGVIFKYDEVTVDVPIPAQSSTTISVVLEGDES
jgi:hypothetical protein